MKIVKLFIFCSVFLILPFIIFSQSWALSPKPTPTQKPIEVNSFELFWPIVAGKVQGESLYSLKLFKEKIRGLFIFSDSRKGEYYSFLSTKRLVEYERLVLVKKDYSNAVKTLKAYEENLQKGNDRETFEKHLSLFEAILMKADEFQKPEVEKAISSLKSQLEKLR